MDETQVIEGVALFTQLGTAVYALRLNRVFGTDRAGWALFGAFALMLAMHVSQVWEGAGAVGGYDLRPELVDLFISALLLIGLTHVGVLFKERLRVEEITRKGQEELEGRIQDRTQELQRLNESLQIEINERKNAEAETRASETRYHELVESLDCIVFEAEGEELRLTLVSHQCERLLGYPPEYWLKGRTWEELLHPEERAKIVPACRQSLESRTNSTFEFRAATADGHEAWLRQFTTVIGDKSDGMKLRGVLVDITEKRTMEMQLRQAQKLESIGRLAGGVAHDFNNMLTVIQGHAAYLLALRETENPITDSLRQIQIASERASQLTNQLLAFGRRQTMRPQPLDMNEVVANVVKMLRRILGEDIALQGQYSALAIIVKADLGMMEQVLLNLAVNARDAMPFGGELTMSTSLITIGEEYLADGVRIQAGPYACLKVNDTGCGIAPEVLPRIFEPFFTTKEIGKGTGLGLATAYGIVRQHQGWIKVTSEVNRGSCFELYLPAASENLPAPTPIKPSETRGGTETILVVEDEEAVREFIVSILKRHGYCILEAETGAAALEVWEEHRSTIDLLLTDLVMPGGISGWQLTEKLKAEQPGLPVICMSGYNPDILLAGAIDDFLGKPFHNRQLVEMVRRVLDRAGSVKEAHETVG